MKMDVHDSQGANVELEITQPGPIDVKKVWTFTFTFQNNFVTVITVDKYGLKAILAYLVHTL